MNYKEYIKKYTKSGIDLTLNRIKIFLTFLNNPEKKLKYIHVAGTNGKGSVSVMLSLILKNSGFKTGLFISPHVLDFKERIQINNSMIPEKELFKILEELEPLLIKLTKEKGIFLTKFELICAIAFYYFNLNKCDIVVLETGLGGRFDATNVISNKEFSVITSVSLDHTNILGHTLEKIAFEKAGIIKENSKIIVGPNIDNRALSVIENVALNKKSKAIISYVNNFKILKEEFFGTEFEFNNEVYFLKLPGIHQINNICTVFSCLKELKGLGYKIPKEVVKKSLKKVKHIARLEILKKEPLIILDGAHNEAGINELKKYILKHFKNKRIFGIFGMLKDKHIGTSLAEILPIFSKLVVLKVNNERSFELDDIYNLSKKYNKNTIKKETAKEAFSYLAPKLQKKDVLIIFGSLYLANEFKNESLPSA